MQRCTGRHQNLSQRIPEQNDLLGVQAAVSYSFNDLSIRLYLRKKELKPCESVISPIHWDVPTGAIFSNFDVRSDIADVITNAKCYLNHFGFFLSSDTPNLLLSMGLDDYNSYNNVSTLELHCAVF